MNPMKQLQKAQKEIKRIKEELKDKRVEGSAGGGAVIVIADGDKEIKDIVIKDEVYEDKEMLRDLLLVATNDALRKSK